MNVVLPEPLGYHAKRLKGEREIGGGMYRLARYHKMRTFNQFKLLLLQKSFELLPLESIPTSTGKLTSSLTVTANFLTATVNCLTTRDNEVTTDLSLFLSNKEFNPSGRVFASRQKV